MTPISSGLTPQQYRFVEEYLFDPTNAAAAARRAGYSEGNAPQQASRNLANPKIRAVIDEAQKEKAQKLGITQDRILQELALIAFSNPKDIVTINEEGDTSININDMSREHASALGEISITTKGGKNKTKTAKIRLWDKISALEKLGKHLGMFRDKVEHTGVLTLEQLVSASMEEDKPE